MSDAPAAIFASGSLRPHPSAGYAYLPGIEAYSCGVRALTGHRLVSLRFRQPPPYEPGIQRVGDWLNGLGARSDCLCAVELRSPAPFTRQGFLDFNRGYCALLERLGLVPGGTNPIARTNVAPVAGAPAAPSLYGCTVALPDPQAAGADFVVAGAGELRSGGLLEARVVAPGDRSPEGMREKMTAVVAAMTRRLQGLETAWDAVTEIRAYTVAPFQNLADELIVRLAGALHGIQWFPSRPPIDELDFEMDVRRVSRVEWLD